jgi:7,8-dihydropterin-6-yl-methyl-4-(beta-D-ribofuranosyl)aminobenzene 5'-phosphate synthase
VKITVAVDNNVPFYARLPLAAEHGVAFLIDTGEQRILYDTGQTGVVVANLDALGIPPTSIDAIALSHGHYDHAGGLLAVLKKVRRDIPVFVHPEAFSTRYSVTAEARVPIGIPFARDYIEAVGGSWRPSAVPTEIVPGLWFSGSIPRVTDFETGDRRLHIGTEAGDAPDPMHDDTVLYWMGSRGLVVIGGCTHSGLVNAVRHGFTVTGQDRLQGWVGGTHLGPVGSEQQDRTIDQLAAWNPEFVAANHCTGFAMMSRLRERFGERFIAAFVGERIEVS